MRNVVFILIAGLFLLGNYYVAKKILFLLEQVMVIKWPGIIITIGLILGIFSLLTFIMAHQNIGSLMGKIGNYWLGFFITAIVIFGLTEGIYRLLLKTGAIKEATKGPVFFIALLFILLFCSYGVWHAQQIKTSYYEVTIDKKQAEKQHVRAVLITDLHLGYINDEKKVEKIVTKINQLKPDIVLISGDLFDGNYYALQKPEQVIEQFKRLSSTYGTYLCWGNHDAGATFDQMENFVKKANITLLEDEAIELTNTAIVVGRKDSRPIGNQGGQRKSIEKQLTNETTNLPIIVMDHQPSTIDEYGEEVDLIVSGHTHQGQIFPFNLVTKSYFTVDYGYYQQDSTHAQVIVSSGVGTWGPPMRVGTQSEIVQIDIAIE